MTTTTKDQALAMIGALAHASVQAYQVANGIRRGQPSRARLLEIRAARQLFKAIAGEEATDQEIGEALGLAEKGTV